MGGRVYASRVCVLVRGETMKDYAITQYPLTKSDAYWARKPCKCTGIQVHSVGCKGTLLPRWVKSWNAPGRDVCPNYLIDMNGIYQLLPNGKRPWLSGRGAKGNANDTALGFEVCEPLRGQDTPDVAADIYGKALYLCVYLCRMYHINPANIMAHYELHALELASNHADVRHWWGKPGTSWEPYNMDRLRRDVASELGVTLTFSTVIKRGSRGDAVAEMQKLLSAAGISVLVDGDFGRQTKVALMSYQSKNGLAADGVCGPFTWAKLYSTKGTARP